MLCKGFRPRCEYTPILRPFRFAAIAQVLPQIRTRITSFPVRPITSFFSAVTFVRYGLTGVTLPGLAI